MLKSRLLLAVIIMFAMTTNSECAQGDQLIKEKCESCHAFVKPEKSDLSRFINRKGQDLYWAGSKYNQEWLVRWLQAPSRIRPSGSYNFTHLSANAGEAASGEAMKSEHIRLSKEDAEAVTEQMMKLTAPADVVEVGIYKPGSTTPEDGAPLFTTMRGCGSCHMWAPGKGGRSSAELYTGAERMKADYIASYINNPPKFDAGAWMPRQMFSNSEIQKFTAFILGLGNKK